MKTEPRINRLPIAVIVLDELARMHEANRINRERQLLRPLATEVDAAQRAAERIAQAIEGGEW